MLEMAVCMEEGEEGEILLLKLLVLVEHLEEMEVMYIIGIRIEPQRMGRIL